MKRMLVLLPAILLAGCAKSASDGASAQASASASAGADAATAQASAGSDAALATVAAAAVKVEHDSKLAHFLYAYPAEAAAIPALKAYLDADLTKARKQLAANANEAGGGGGQYDSTTEWSVVTALPGWLSLLSSSYQFSGGAHGMTSSSVLLWDKSAGQARDPLSLFLSKQAFDSALGTAYCVALNKERLKRRGEPVNPDSDDSFDTCPDPSSLTVLLGSADKAHFTRIGLIADQYVVGSYAEGAYEVTLPVTPGLIRAVKPEFRGAFAVGR